MSYTVRISLFLLGATIVAGALGYFSAFFEPWMLEFLVIGLIVLAIEIGRKVLKRDRL